jgi:DNA end-binding protein Ku
MRALWSGSLSFGLINIPVRIFSATLDRTLNFVMLHNKDLSPIRFARICKADGKEIPYEDIVKGYEYQPGDYVVLVEEDFEQANVKKTKSIEIMDFIDEKEIDTIYYEKPYFLEPGKGADKAYVLLREALKKSKKVALAKFVLHNREHLAVVKPYDQIIILNQLRYNSELKKPDQLQLPASVKTSPQEITMALKLIDQLTGHFEPEKYHDTYTEELENIIEAKAKGKKPRAKGKEPKITPVKDMMRLLKESLEDHHRKTA